MQEFLMRPMSILPCSRRLTFIRAENCHLFDTEGKTYLDAFAANGDIVAGHAEPLIRDAYANPSEDSSTRLLKELTRLLPGYLSTFQLFKSGVQAVREACEISRRYRNKSHIIGISEDATQNNFLILASSEGDSFTPLFSIDTNFELISHAGTNPPVIGHKKLSAINTSPRGACLSSFENFFSELTDQTAAIVIEPSAGVGGAIESCRKFFGMLEEFCLANGIDLISNETQCGLGRTGSRLFGFQLLNIHPNIVCIGPSLANGYPIGVSV
ncbi:MAG: aminotransferase class III-fold pyridoxal phosphate-dependent enzyme, partial [Erysipelotrichia bacterium]|nr:aminotransferase class III-fold pyridoxal phosphate-dependent enzyme [Erysipelotrichia bacterium]